MRKIIAAQIQFGQDLFFCHLIVNLRKILENSFKMIIYFSFVRDCSTKTPLSLPIPQVIFSDAQYTILPDVSSFRYHDKNV